MKAGPALAAGNAIIIKTSEKAPLACAFAAGLTKEAGFPPGIISVLTGAGETGKLLAEHSEIRKISFTGSTNTGRLGELVIHPSSASRAPFHRWLSYFLVATAAVNSNLKEVSLELGGKTASIVFEDADLDKAAASLAFSLLWSTYLPVLRSSPSGMAVPMRVLTGWTPPYFRQIPDRFAWRQLASTLQLR